MNPAENDPPLSERDALMMGYVDDELSSADRRRFETMMADDPALATEVADYRTMLDMGKASASLEPTEREMRRFWARFHNRAEWHLGWSLLLGGVAVLLAAGIYEVIISTTLSTMIKAALLSTMAGGAILGWSILRQRRIQLRFDRYRGVMR